MTLKDVTSSWQDMILLTALPSNQSFERIDLEVCYCLATSATKAIVHEIRSASLTVRANGFDQVEDQDFSNMAMARITNSPRVTKTTPTACLESAM